MLSINKRIFVGFVGLASFLYGYEPSVYGAGDINSASPYGLTKTEKAVLENKKTLQMLYNRMTEQERKIAGLTTIIDGQNREILELKESLEAEVKSNSSKDENGTYSLLLELGQSIDHLNNTYVSKDELQNFLSANGGNSNVNPSVMPPIGTNSNPADNYRKGVQLFSKRSYGAAKEHFEEAVAINYKPAASKYYLGEIAYYTHEYKVAVSYYKESSALYDQASYMDVLFLHTAIALDKSGESVQAKSFYQYVIDNYPKKKSASIARNRM